MKRETYYLECVMVVSEETILDFLDILKVSDKQKVLVVKSLKL